MKCKVKGIRVINTILCDVLGFSLLVCSGFAWGEIIVDNTFNGHERPVLPNKGTMTIDQSLGKISGKNLFHSFKVFDINKGQTAIFTNSGNHAINNVISRVTGDGISHINGTLVVDKGTMPNADFYFINPNGVMFGKGSEVNVPGAFHVSTANSLKFNDGGLYSATLPDTASSFATTPPENFGFLGGQHQKQAALSIKGENKGNETDPNQITKWRFKENQKATFTAGTILIDGVQIKSPSGVILLHAIGDAKADISIDNFNTHNLRNLQYNGNVQINNSTLSTADGDASGLIVVQAGDISVSNNSLLTSWHKSTRDAPIKAGIFIGATNALNIIENGKIEASNRGNGKGGQVIINAGELYINGEGSGIFNNAGCDHGLCDNTGSGGAITINVEDKVTVKNSGVISSTSYSKFNGAAGIITIKADKLMMQDAAIKTEVNNPNTAANGGLINLLGRIIRLNDSQITTSVNGNGTGGDITISGKNEATAKGLILNGGFIQANGNKGGTITNNVDTLLASHAQLQLGENKREEFQPGFNVIQAASKDGESGTIKSTAPELNITGAMLNLKSGFLQSPDLNASPCTSGKGSSLVQSGYGGLPRKPSDAIYVPGSPNTLSATRKTNITAIGKHNLICKPNGK